MNNSLSLVEVGEAVSRAESRIRPYVLDTPLKISPKFGELCEARVFFKYENLQRTGSFKVRGATNALLSLSEEERCRGVVTASTGNHGIAIAYVSNRLGVRATIFVPVDSSPIKVDHMRRLGGNVREHGVDGVQAEVHARKYAATNGSHYVSPYNDPDVLVGQGTVGCEIYRHLPEADTIFVAVGGGGLISGMGAYLTRSNPGINMIGCSPENSAVMVSSIRKGRLLQITSKETISDGTAGGIESGSITFDLCRELVPDLETVREKEIIEALRLFIDCHGMPIEGAAAVAVASLLKRRESIKGSCVVVVLCGGNIDPDNLKRAIY